MGQLPSWLDTEAGMESWQQQFKLQKGQATPSYPCGLSEELYSLSPVSVAQGSIPRLVNPELPI